MKRREGALVVKVVAGCCCSGADFEMANAGFWADLLFGWGGCTYGGM